MFINKLCPLDLRVTRGYPFEAAVRMEENSRGTGIKVHLVLGRGKSLFF
jgi:hypothetical protein